MKVIHPQVPVNNLPIQDVFLAVDDFGTQLGQGHVIYQMQPHLYPDCPVNIYFTMECKAQARYLLLGALVARARMLRDVQPNLSTRIYTNVAPEDVTSRMFYEEHGFDCNETEEFYQLMIPAGDGMIPMSCSVAVVPLNTPEERQAFIARLHQNDLNYVTVDYLTTLQQMPHFQALGLYRNMELIGEVLMAGQGNTCELIAIYVTQPNRRQGMGKALLHRAMAIMAAEGVNRVTARCMSRSIPQTSLIRDFSGQSMGVNVIYPGILMK